MLDNDRGFSSRFGNYLAAAQHQDRIRSWPWVGRLLHWLLVSWRCPACKYWKQSRGYLRGR